ncbi:hypothetical protein AB0M47_38575 [Hamadaea sp. NPDC051192]|uniref:hypothetical protein n=1 Tax=Hamadaea sp. NPDC051192 TaxID=3154940 RepID=UPI00344AB625
MVVAALQAGTSAGITATTATAVSECYAALKMMVIRRLQRDGTSASDTESLIAGIVGDPQALIAALSDVHSTDPVVHQAAELLATLGRQNGRTTVRIASSTGIMVGDHNQQTIHVRSDG